jgi:hypothetical protein
VAPAWLAGLLAGVAAGSDGRELSTGQPPGMIGMCAASAVLALSSALVVLMGDRGQQRQRVQYRFNLAPAPSPFPAHQAYYNSSTWSWGGALIHVPDDPHGHAFHLFAEAEARACGVHAWGTNARVMHAVAPTAAGPFRWSDDPFAPCWQWRAGPDISRAPDGTFLLMVMAQDFPYASAVNCIDGVGDYLCRVNGTLKKAQYPCEPHALFRNRLYSSQSVYGPWVEVHNETGGDVIPASINANGVVHALPNGTVVIFGGGIHVARHWSGPYVKQDRSLQLNDPKTGSRYDFKACPMDPRNAANHARWPQAACALEDIFVWFDVARQRWRWLAHQKLKGAGSRTEHQCNYFPGVVGFAQSDTEDLWGPWTYDFWAPAAGLHVNLSNGTQDYCLESRERPKVAVIANRTFLTNSACPTHMGPGDSRCFTFLQEVVSENGGHATQPKKARPLKSDDHWACQIRIDTSNSSHTISNLVRGCHSDAGYSCWRPHF